MEERAKYQIIRFVLGLATLLVGLFGVYLTFNWAERIGTHQIHYALGNNARYVCALGGFASTMLGAMMVRDYLRRRNMVGHELPTRQEIQERKTRAMKSCRDSKRTTHIFGLLLLMIVTLSFGPLIVSSFVSHTATAVIVPKLWLGGWDKRVKITIDQNDIDSNLTDFPVLIYLSNSSGRLDDNLTCIFDELQSDSNRKKIAVTTDSPLTQCYVEIEKWDNMNKQAWLWVKVPNISDNEDTVLYIYYDSNQSENTGYVGDPNSAVSGNVWDDNFRLVCHMQDDPDDSHVRDSTSTNNDGTKSASGEPIEVEGFIGEAQYFDGSNDHISVTNNESLNSDYGTWEAWVYWDRDTTANYKYIFDHGYTGRFLLYTVNLQAWVTTNAGTVKPTTSYLPLKEWHHVAVTHNGSQATIYVDGIEEDSKGISSTLRISSTDFYIGSYRGGGIYRWEGMIDEARFSSTGRNGAWIKATYESERDHLIDFGNEENIPP